MCFGAHFVCYVTSTGSTDSTSSCRYKFILNYFFEKRKKIGRRQPYRTSLCRNWYKLPQTHDFRTQSACCTKSTDRTSSCRYKLILNYFFEKWKKLGVVNPTGPLYVGTGTSFRKFKILGHSHPASTRSTYDTLFRLPPCRCTISCGSARVPELPGDAASAGGGCRTARCGRLTVRRARSCTQQ